MCKDYIEYWACSFDDCGERLGNVDKTTEQCHNVRCLKACKGKVEPDVTIFLGYFRSTHGKILRENQDLMALLQAQLGFSEYEKREYEDEYEELMRRKRHPGHYEREAEWEQ